MVKGQLSATKMSEQDELDINPFFKALQRRKNERVYWSCSIRNMKMKCPAGVKQFRDLFTPSPVGHIHPADPGALKKVTISAKVKAVAKERVFEPAAAIVERVMKEMTDTNDINLPKPDNLTRAANHHRRQRPDDPVDLDFEGKYLSTYEKAQEDCNLICLPHSECLQGVVITDKFVDTHILKPSPFFKGQYRTLKSDKQIVSIEEDGDYIQCQEGFPTKSKVKIICEELGYNKEYKPYKMLIIARPLDHNVLRKSNIDTASSSGEFHLKCSLKECREYLNSVPEFSKPIKELDDQIQKFMRSYIILKDYLLEVADRLETMATDISKKCIERMKERKLCEQKFRDILTAAVETCVLGSVYQKLYPVVCSKCADVDKRMLTKCRSLSGLTPEHLGVPKHFCCPVTSAVVELAHLDNLVTPVEKMYCLKTTIDNITEDISKNTRTSQSLGVQDEDVPCLTSDELLPILVTVLVQAKCNHIHSDLFYMENFYWSAAYRDKDTLSYCLVTFKAAVQYLMTTSFDDIDLETNGAKNEMTVKELVETRRLSFNREDDSGRPSGSIDDTKVNGSYAPSKSRFDQQMDNISKMLEESTKQMGSKDKKAVKQPVVSSIFGGQVMSVSPQPDQMSQPTTQNKKEDMGDFLSSLQDDMFLSFGKQT